MTGDKHSPRVKPVVRDFEMESEPLGATTRMILLESDPTGGLYFQFGRRPARSLALPVKYGQRMIGVIDMVQMSALLDPNNNRLIALAAYPSVGTRIFLFGSDWGTWIDEDGQVHRSASIPEAMRQWRIPVAIVEPRQQLGFDFQINVHYREVFTRQALNAFRNLEDRHSLNFMYHYPSGGLAEAKVIIHDPQSHKVLGVNHVYGFPLNWPAPPSEGMGSAKAEAKPKSSPGPGPQESKDTHKGPAGLLAGIRRPPLPTPAAPAPEPKEKPVPPTEHLSTHELISVLSTEPQPARRWRMIEPNLMQGRPERTYPLILQHTELISEQTAQWPAARLKMAFANQPGSVLIAIMAPWMNNQILALCETSAESERIMEWLREREIDRLMKVDLTKEPVSAEDARGLLHVDRLTEPAMIKKVWRTLLGFLNADIGRVQERAIHRKKDEIAKLLQSARNILLKKG